MTNQLTPTQVTALVDGDRIVTEYDGEQTLLTFRAFAESESLPAPIAVMTTDDDVWICEPAQALASGDYRPTAMTLTEIEARTS